MGTPVSGQMTDMTDSWHVGTVCCVTYCFDTWDGVDGS